ncbi:MAG: VWA domain-containing protein [Candidatus Sericytochromatia bacterium]|nr:VWA domain-containing protein [Candidatus Sericytochromatia bacterium]
MNRPLFLLLGSLLSLQLSACQVPGLTGDLGQLPDQSGITPGPKGPKPTDGIITLPNLSLPPALAPEAAMADQARAGNAQMTGAMPGQTDMLNQPFATEEPQPTATPSPAPTSSSAQEPPPEPVPPVQMRDFFYFSYDDSASTAGVEQTLYALENNLPPNPAWVRPWEFLNYERIGAGQAAQLRQAGPFSVSAGLWQHALPASDATAYDLGIYVGAPDISRDERRPLVLTLVLDVSGSMNNASGVNNSNASLLDLARMGLQALPAQLKAGDTINLVSFSNQAKVRLQNWTYQGDPAEYLAVVNALETEGGTDLNAGLKQAYALAREAYQPDAINRVLMLTDAYANQGQIDATEIARNTRMEDREGIYFSGLGFGAGFNEAFLNTLTEAGQGTYASVITEADARRSFGERFMALVNIAARDVRFRLDYPAALTHVGSAAEQRSQTAAEVQPVHFSYNTSQFFLERFTHASEGDLLAGNLTLTISYTDPVTGAAREETLDFDLDAVRNQNLAGIKDARLVLLLTQLIRGQVSPEQARSEMEALLATHSSPLAARYKGYLETWLRLSGGDTPVVNTDQSPGSDS